MRKSSDITVYGWEIDMVAAAIVGVGLVSAGASAYSAHQSGNAQKNALRNSNNIQMATLDQQKEFTAPYRQLGSDASVTLRGLLGIGGGTDQSKPDPNAATSMLRSLPGYQFQKQEGLDATKNAASSMGLALSGNTLKALDQYSTGLADSTYQQQVGNLQNVVNTGESAATNTAAMAGQVGNNLSNNAQAYGNVQASQNAALNKSFQSALESVTSASTLADIYDFYEPPRKVMVLGRK